MVKIKRIVLLIYKLIRVPLKKAFDNINNAKLKENLLQALPFWTGAFLTGLIAVFYAQLFHYAEMLLEWIFKEQKIWMLVITPLCFIISWLIVNKYAPMAKGSGIPQVMSAIDMTTPKHAHLIKHLLSFKIIIVKIISSLVMVIGGGAIGREGPTIQIAGSIFNMINKWLPSWWPKISQKNMIMTGAAAGLAAAFNTPLGGIVFTIEELTKTHINYFKTALFTGIVIAGLTAQGIIGPYLYLGYPKVANITLFSIVWVIITSIACGLLGAYFSKIILNIIRFKNTLKNNINTVFFIVGSATIVVFIAFFIDKSILGSGKNIMTDLLFGSNKEITWYVPVFRMLGPIISFTNGGAGGIFAPSLAAGASVGAYLAGLLELNNSETNLLILSGMVAFLTGVTRSPFTSAILVLEMTDRHSLIFFLMMAGLASNLAAIPVDSKSLYDHLKENYLNAFRKNNYK
ncbi:MAG: chloride channel protein [Vicingaceae bacterium]